MSEKRVAVMQPYFFPYSGYFRLFTEVDEFVVLDCVQFPRRGRVHRTQVPGPNGDVEWLTLPLARQSRSVLIRELAFSGDARQRFDERLGRLPWVRKASGPASEIVREFLFRPLESVVDYLEAGLRLVLEILDVQRTISRSSQLEIDPRLRAQDRILAILSGVGASHYLNPPGGRALYRDRDFRRAGIDLRFLPPYGGRYNHLLHALMTETPEAIRTDIGL